MTSRGRFPSNAGAAVLAIMLTGASISSVTAQTAPGNAAALPMGSTSLSALPSTGAAAASPGAPSQNLTDAPVDKAKSVAAHVRDILDRVPCLPPKGISQSMGSLPHVAAKLAANKPVVIVAFGSSSTQGYGATSPEFNYPNQLAARLRRKYPAAAITVINRGKGGEDAPEMMKRLRSEVIDARPDMVIWQVGTNAVLRNLDPASTAKTVEDGVATIQASGADLVLVDPQYAPAVNARGENAGRMVSLLSRVAHYRHVGIFPRFEVMRDWHDRQSLPFDTFVNKDGLHMNDWGYACFAQLLGDDIIKSVDQMQAGVRLPAAAAVNRPL
ncbi:SGNH/GDSL hydrolase family protein [Nitrobacter sp.]|uniref:SGNH/GDSL hydrolase family protein n=1 Tax=Nitrobacter sp. TaxID=29420 RepID=UPI003F6514CE